MLYRRIETVFVPIEIVGVRRSSPPRLIKRTNVPAGAERPLTFATNGDGLNCLIVRPFVEFGFYGEAH
jgi:hypothetical protein